MTEVIAIVGVSVLVFTLRRTYYKTPPILPQLGRALGLLPGLLAAVEARAQSYYQGQPLRRLLSPPAPKEDLWDDEWPWPKAGITC